MAELIAYVKAHPGTVNYSSYGNNTSNHLVGELFKATAGIDSVHVPYKGSGPSIIDLIGGQVQYTFDTPAATLNQVKAGKLKAIAVATPQRLVSAPNVPTMAESGLPGFVGGTWFGLLAPAKTPKPIVDKLSTEVQAALSSPELRKTSRIATSSLPRIRPKSSAGSSRRKSTSGVTSPPRSGSSRNDARSAQTRRRNAAGLQPLRSLAPASSASASLPVGGACRDEDTQPAAVTDLPMTLFRCRTSPAGKEPPARHRWDGAAASPRSPACSTS